MFHSICKSFPYDNFAFFLYCKQCCSEYTLHTQMQMSLLSTLGVYSGHRLVKTRLTTVERCGTALRYNCNDLKPSLLDRKTRKGKRNNVCRV